MLMCGQFCISELSDKSIWFHSSLIVIIVKDHVKFEYGIKLKNKRKFMGVGLVKFVQNHMQYTNLGWISSSPLIPRTIGFQTWLRHLLLPFYSYFPQLRFGLIK